MARMDREIVELVGGLVEAVLFLLLSREGADNPYSCEIASRSGKDIVELILHLHESRDRLHHDDIDHDRDHGRRNKRDQSEPHVDRK